MNHLTQIDGPGDRTIIQILSEQKLIVSDDGIDGINVMVGDQVITLLLGRHTLLGLENSLWYPTISQFKIGE